MKTILRSLAALIVTVPLLTIISIAPAAAHVLKQNNGISAVLHIDPDDNPLAGQPTLLQLSFGDAKDAFSLPDCNCSASVTSNGKTIETVALRPAAVGATLSADASVTFPNVGVYDVIVSGSAKDGAFHTFSLDYLERVATSAYAPKSSSEAGAETLLIGGGAIVILVMVAQAAIKRSGRYAVKPIMAAKAKSKGVKK